MPEINILINNPKFFEQKTASIVEVSVINRVDLHEDLIKFDNVFEYKYIKARSNPRVMLLVLVGDKCIPFTIIMDFDEKKYDYYLSCRHMLITLNYPI